MSEQRKEDIPTIVAAVMWTAPTLVIRTGFAYLKLRRDMQKSARVFYQGMVDSGMPLEQAQRLREKYESDMSTRGLMKTLGISRPGGSSTQFGK